MHPEITICMNCGKAVYSTPGVCVLCGEEFPVKLPACMSVACKPELRKAA